MADSTLQSLSPDEAVDTSTVPDPSQSSGPPDSSQLLQQYLMMAKGNADDALVKAVGDRQGDELNPAKRDAEHVLFSQKLMDLFGPIGPMLTPAYSGAKAYAQSGLPGAGLLNRASTAAGVPLAGPTTSAPSMGEVAAGLSPLAGNVVLRQIYTLMKLHGLLK